MVRPGRSGVGMIAERRRERVRARDAFSCRCRAYKIDGAAACFWAGKCLGSPGVAAPLKVFLIDDHPVVRAGLRLLLEGDAQFGVCGETGDVAGAQRGVAELRPEFVVLDLVLGGRDGTELIEDLLVLEPGLRVLVYSSQPEQPWARRALRAGARGYVPKTAGLEEVRRALAMLAKGELCVGAAVQRSLVEDYARLGGRGPLEALSDRELQVFRLLGTGLGSAEVAAELRLGMRTIGTYRERLKNKLGLESARDLERCAEEFVRTGRLATEERR